MDQDQLKKYKTKLEKERTMVAAEIARDEKPVDFGDDIDHEDEATDKSEEVGNQLAAAQELKDRLNEIEIALGKIRVGRTGFAKNAEVPSSARSSRSTPNRDSAKCANWGRFRFF